MADEHAPTYHFQARVCYLLRALAELSLPPRPPPDRIMRSALPLILACIGALAACTHPSPNFEVEFIPSPRPDAVFSPAVRVGNLLFLSWQIGSDTANRLVPGGLQAEARQALNNIKRVLEQNGSSLDRVVKCTVFLADIRE